MSSLCAILYLLCTVLAYVNAASSLAFTSHVGDGVEVRLGESVTISGTLAGYPDNFVDYNIAWTINGLYYAGMVGTSVDAFADILPRNISNQGVTYLTINKAITGFDGQAKLQVKPATGLAVLSDPIQILVLVPPTNIEVSVNGGGSTVTDSLAHNLTCTASGSNPEVTISWMLDGVAVAGGITSHIKNGNADYTTTGVLPIQPTHASHGDRYECVIGGKPVEDPILRPLTITVQYKPRVTMSTSSEKSYQMAGDDFTMSCQATALPGAITWKWFLDDEELPNTDSSITYNGISADMNGKTLKCQATNSIGSSEMTHSLLVYYSPEWVETASNIESDIGENVQLKCAATGNPTPDITWSKMDGQSSRIIVSNQDLVINGLRDQDFGKYRCSAAVGHFYETLKHDVHIFKKDVPIVDNSENAPPLSYKYKQGDDADIVCRATCIPAPSQILWTKGKSGESIDISSNRYSVHKNQSLDVITSTLSIKDLASTDFDTYNCTIVNVRGADHVIFTLQQKNDFPWKWALGVAAGVTFISIVIAVTVCVCRRGKNKTSSAGTLSVGSQSTDNSMKKPADGLDNVELSSLPEYGMRPIDRWRNNEEPNGSNVFDTADYHCHEQKPELYGTYSQTVSTFNPRSAYPPGNYGSYRVHHPSVESSNTVPPYSTLPIRPANMRSGPELDAAFQRSPYVDTSPYTGQDEVFPEPPLMVPEHRLATNV